MEDGYSDAMTQQTTTDFFTLVDACEQDPMAREALTQSQIIATTLVIHLAGTAHHVQHRDFLTVLAANRAAFKSISPVLKQYNALGHHSNVATLSAQFSHPTDALFAAFDAMIGLHRHSQQTATTHAHPSMGIGHGACHWVAEGQCWGQEVFQACQLGEKVAKSGQILATPAFRQALNIAPQGVGIHDGNNDIAHRIGFHFVEIRDYRD